MWWGTIWVGGARGSQKNLTFVSFFFLVELGWGVTLPLLMVLLLKFDLGKKTISSQVQSYWCLNLGLTCDFYISIKLVFLSRSDL